MKIGERVETPTSAPKRQIACEEYSWLSHS